MIALVETMALHSIQFLIDFSEFLLGDVAFVFVVLFVLFAVCGIVGRFFGQWR